MLVLTDISLGGYHQELQVLVSPKNQVEAHNGSRANTVGYFQEGNESEQGREQKQ